MQSQWYDKIFGVTEEQFESVALQIFRHQARLNPVYAEYLQALGKDPDQVSKLDQIPYLPIGLFKTRDVQTGSFIPELIFESSGTSGTVNSRHLVKDVSLYRESFRRCFNLFYGGPEKRCIIGLLPSYLERSNSSLVYMVNDLIRESAHPKSGFYLDQTAQLLSTIRQLEQDKQPTLLIGVSFALLDLATAHRLNLRYVQVMETGGMKGRKKEMIRAELHNVLREGFDLPRIHSEYGMTELLSQAYSDGEGRFRCPPWMRVQLRDEEDPLLVRAAPLHTAVTGAVNVIDLANLHSCSFIATDDAGRLYPDGSFEVLGRLDNSDLRGCSLLSL